MSSRAKSNRFASLLSLELPIAFRSQDSSGSINDLSSNPTITPSHLINMVSPSLFSSRCRYRSLPSYDCQLPVPDLTLPGNENRTPRWPCQLIHPYPSPIRRRSLRTRNPRHAARGCRALAHTARIRTRLCCSRISSPLGDPTQEVGGDAGPAEDGGPAPHFRHLGADPARHGAEDSEGGRVEAGGAGRAAEGRARGYLDGEGY